MQYEIAQLEKQLYGMARSSPLENYDGNKLNDAYGPPSLLKTPIIPSSAAAKENALEAEEQRRTRELHLPPGRKEASEYMTDPCIRPKDRNVCDVMNDKLYSDTDIGVDIDPYRFVTHRKRKPEDIRWERHIDMADQEAIAGKPCMPNITPKRGVMMKPATYDGTGSWTDYKAHFEACAEINGWSEQDKGLYVAVALRGQAQGVLSNLDTKTNSYDELMTALQERFAPPNQTELYRAQLRERRQKASETLSELAQDIRRLTNFAYPTAPIDVRETLAKEQFVDSLFSSDMRIRVKQSRPTNLNDAVRHAVELEAFHRAEKKKSESQGYMRSANPQETDKAQNDIAKLQTTLSELQSEFRMWRSQHASGSLSDKNQNRNRTTIRRCYECGSPTHFKRDCPKLRKDDATAGSTAKSDRKVNASYRQGSGLFVSASIDGQTANCLIDTGATLTVIASKLWEHSSQKQAIAEFHKEILSASGNPLDIKGTTNVTIKIGNMSCKTQVVVADIENDALLGLDFLKQENCVVNTVKNTMSLAKGKLYS